MSETKLPDIVERLLTYIPLASYDGVVLAHIAIFKEAAAKITRLRSHAGWHEAIEEAAKVLDKRAERWRLLAGDGSYDTRMAGILERENKMHAQDIRALLPPGGEKGVGVPRSARGRTVETGVRNGNEK